MSENLTAALSAAFTGVQTDVLGIVEMALPIGLGIVAVIMGIKIGVKFFKGIAKA